MDTRHIEDDLKSFLVNTLKIVTKADQLDAGASLVDDLGVDSAGMFELILWLEDRYSLEIPPADMELGNFATIRAAATYILRLQSSSATADGALS
jgi:acyl carrier protein